MVSMRQSPLRSVASLEGEVPPSTFGDGVYCPGCGYHLRGIAEAKCPECGLGYDHRAIRNVAQHAAWCEDLAARRAIYGGAFAIACFLGEAARPHRPTKAVEFAAVCFAWMSAMALFWYYRDLRAPSAWTGPVSNGPVAITFRQPIAANDPLRTGTYAKTVTFTLSTTTP